MFYSKSLCGSHDLCLPIGVGAELPNFLSEERFHDANSNAFDGGPNVPRNAPTTFNMIGWDQVLFHDGRVESMGKTVGENGADGLGIVYLILVLALPILKQIAQ